MGVVINDHGLFIISEKAVELATFGQVPDCFYGLVDLGRGGGLCKRCQYMHLFFDFATAPGVAWLACGFGDLGIIGLARPGRDGALANPLCVLSPIALARL